jgi:hypothetical protein
MNHRMGEQNITIHYLLVGVQGFGEVHVARWFVKEGQRLRAKDPLVTLQSGVDGPMVTLRVTREDSIEGAVVERIFCAEGARVTERDCLAVFTASGTSAGRAISRLEDLGDLAQYPVVYVDYVIASTSLLRELLDRRFPGFARWYFKTYPLMPLIKMAGTLALLALGGLLTHSILDSLRDLEGPPVTPWWDNLWLLLLPFFLGVLVCLALFVLRYLALKRISPRSPGATQRQVQR